MSKTSMKHPLTGFTYEVDTTGLVRVTDPDSHRYGLFDSNAVWVEGEIRDVDLQVVGWIGRTPEAKRRLAEHSSG